MGSGALGTDPISSQGRWRRRRWEGWGRRWGIGGIGLGGRFEVGWISKEELVAQVLTTYSVDLISTSCWCGLPLAIPRNLYEEARRRTTSIYCPVGHTFVYGNTEVAGLKEALKEKDQALARERMLRQTAEAERDSERKRRKRVLHRVEKGVCPKCNSPMSSAT